MKPITYWIQNDAINQLVERYGYDLGKLRPESRRELIAFLANAENYWATEESDADDAFRIVQTLTRHQKDKLIEAIAASLVHHGIPLEEIGRDLVQPQKSIVEPDESA